MRTALFLAAGLLFLAACFIIAKLFAENVPAAATWATAVFVAVWLMVTTANLWIGVSRAGYSVAEEIPILVLLFGVPAAVALLLRWKVL